MLIFISINKLERKQGNLHFKEVSLVTIIIMQCWNHSDCWVSEQLQSHVMIIFIKTIALKYCRNRSDWASSEPFRSGTVRTIPIGYLRNIGTIPKTFGRNCLFIVIQHLLHSFA